MATNIVEFFGYAPSDQSPAAVSARADRKCPFVGATCTKTLNRGEKSGACTLKPARSGPVICCPNRLYAQDYKILTDVATIAFGPDVVLVAGSSATAQLAVNTDAGKATVAVFGKRWGGELRLPNRADSGSYFVDWILAKLHANGQVESFVAIEVQSIDTTGNYQAERIAYLQNEPYTSISTAGFNWENVNKRILPQLIYKGHVLRREPLCTKGLFFVCPTQVYDKIRERLGNSLLDYKLQSGALSFAWYGIGAPTEDGVTRSIEKQGNFITTVDQVAMAFTSPSNLPPSGVYEEAINRALAG